MLHKILVVAAHPDDEVVGCGGTIALLAAQDAQVHVAFMADGVSSRHVIPENCADLKGRRTAARRAAEVLGIQSVSFGDFRDNRMDGIELLDVVKCVEALIEEHRPDAVISHHAGDLNIDHRRVHEAVVTACRPQQSHPVKTLLFFEVASSTEWQTPGSGSIFAPNWFFDVSGVLDRKMTALDAYATELRDWPHPRSRQGIEYLARWRGATVGVQAAEAFMLGRQLL